MAEDFDGDWLDLREAYDAVARDLELGIALAEALPARPRLLDLGSGTGSLIRWLGPIIDRAQAWTMVDADAGLMSRAFDTMAERAEAIGLNATFPGKKTLLVHTPGGAWRVEGLLADLADAPDVLPLDRVDAVVCSALCDLVSRGWVTRMAAACAARRLPFYASLNVTGRERFLPPHPIDAIVMRGFRRDQRRDKGFGGTALGPAATEALATAFAAQGYTVLRTASDWRIDRRSREMAGMIAEGHAKAALPWERRRFDAILAWSKARADQAMARRLSVMIGHQDLLALPPD
ncbi:class I SAM-dependent methyltransferase [Roseomonas terrae]|jgi:SAM-dependent methyltransferase|uniref:Class I SAM-dependent methyltransferase n=1 Tax=Neoroseomonas terrae TaxID=424799 RepID=A0ABS5ED73_9PROT|nr:class I SAM-dependent methyltransferase [Neoroseomonas terrae]MBR0648977.1 class I SAM-dependent methyltransferase [Neoroseomonas terrae]